MSELTYLPAAEMARLILSRKISPVELVEAHLDRAEKLHPQLNAIVQLDPEGALRQARAAEKAIARRDPLAPLHGVPVTIKSSIAVAGLRAETGTKLRAGYVAEEDAPLVARLRAAGAIILGVTNVPEMLLAYDTQNLLYGRTNNPWNLSRTAGGSSGGEAAAIAAGCSAAGVGSDGGGSIRVPAHFCGICGLKPTPGRIPATGHFPPSIGPFALLGVVGPMARTVGDLELLFEVMAGPDSRDASAPAAPVRRWSESELRRLRIGCFEDDSITPVTPETRAAVRAAARGLEQQGFTVEELRPDGLDQARQLWWVLFGLAGALMLVPMLPGHEAELSPTLREFLSTVAAEPPLSAQRLLAAWVERDQCASRLLDQMRKFPVLICPVCAVPAFRHGEGSWSARATGVSYLSAMRYSQWFNLTGNPGVVVPVGRSAEGLPIGVQVVARPYEDEVALAVSRQIEQVRGGWECPPM
jgi:Asp-tRNA(Asn)/Glu-tRNA(Gln) amidotransferase A subunit family amidase